MSDLETRLRDLAGLDTGRADPRALAAGARRRASRIHRLRLATACSAVVALLIIAGLALGDRHDRAAVPATPTGTSLTGVALCAFGRSLTLPPPPLDALPSDYAAEVAVCPTAKDAAAWKSLPSRTLTGPALRFLALSFGGPPIEQCPRNDALLGDFSFVIRDTEGSVRVAQSSGLRCRGLHSLRSFYLALAESQAAQGESPGDVSGMCPGLLEAPARPSSVEDMVLCIHPALAPAYVDPVPVYTPVRAVRLTGRDLTEASSGLEHPTTVGPEDERGCPYAKANVVIWHGLATEPVQVLYCEFSGTGNAVASATWKIFPPATQRIIEDAIRAAGYEPFVH